MTEKEHNKLQDAFENKALRMLLKEFRSLFANIKAKDLFFDEIKTEASILLNINEKALEKCLYKIHYTIGIQFGRLTARQFRKENPIQIKAFQPLGNFDKEFTEFLLEQFRIYGGRQIKTLTKTASRAVIIELRKGAKLGETEEQMRDRLLKRINRPDFYKYQAQRIARTETTVAMNEAHEIAMIGSGAKLDKVWISRRDGRERDSHHAAHKQQIAQDKLFLVGVSNMSRPGDRSHGAPAEEIVNCYLPGNFIESNIIGGQKSFYSGKALKIVTRRGESLTVTPNHGILTDNGFVIAKNLNIGDNLVCNRFNNNRFFVAIHNHIKKKIFTVENVFSSLNKLWFFEKRLIGALDFDGDGQSMNRYIDIVYPKINLVDSTKPGSVNFINYFKFKIASLISFFVSRFGSFNFFGSANKATPASFMSFLHLSFPLLFRHFRPLHCFTFGLASKLNVIRFKEGRDSRTADAVFLSELIDTNSGNISIDDIIGITEFDFSGHVYDFTSYNGVNIVNNIYTSNCRCRLEYKPKRSTDGRMQFNDEQEIQDALLRIRGGKGGRK